MAIQSSRGIIAVLSSFAAGITFGLGFVAAASKFKATRPDVLALLDVGRIQFISLHVLEGILIPIVAVLCFSHRGALRLIGVLLSSFFIVKFLVVLPGLDARMTARLAGQTPGPSWHHDVYTFLAAGMLLSLLAIALVAVLERVPLPAKDRERVQQTNREQATT